MPPNKRIEQAARPLVVGAVAGLRCVPGATAVPSWRGESRWHTNRYRQLLIRNTLASQEVSFLKPIVFVLGLSGVGKDHAAHLLVHELSFWHQNMDRKRLRGFELAGFPSEWDRDASLANLTVLASGIRAGAPHDCPGIVLTFPTTCRFTREQLEGASAHRIAVVLLWGSLERCLSARRVRQQENKGTRLDQADYLKKNRPTFDAYQHADLDRFRVEAFEPDGSRPSGQVLLARILSLLANSGIEQAARTAGGGRG